MNILGQYLAEVDLLQGESDEKEFVASFALQLLVMECTAAWSASHVNIVEICLENMRTATWALLLRSTEWVGSR